MQKPEIHKSANHEHSVVVGFGTTGTPRGTRVLDKALVFFRQLLRTRHARIVGLVIAVFVVGFGATFAYIAFKDSQQPLSVASEKTQEGALKIDTDGDGVPDTVVGDPETSDSADGAGGQSGAQGGTGGGSGGSSGGGSSSGGSSGGGGGGSASAQSCPAYPAFPDASCTGVPSGVTLGAYTGPCTITANNTVIDSKTVNCSLSIEATGVVIKNSRINGTVQTPNGSLAYSFTITDSEVIAPQATAIEQTGIAEANFTALRVEVTGGNRGIYCRKSCTVQDSWVHGTNIADSPRIHASGIRQSQNATIVHNRIHCSAEDTSTGGGCSANLTGYGDFEPVQDNLIEKNLFVATPGGACAYGGSSGDDGTKPYGHLAQNIVFKDNVFQRGSEGNCGYYFPITDFDDTRPGNQWINNKWEDGATLPPAN